MVGLPTWHFKGGSGSGYRLFPLILGLLQVEVWEKTCYVNWAGNGYSMYSVLNWRGDQDGGDDGDDDDGDSSGDDADDENEDEEDKEDKEEEEEHLAPDDPVVVIPTDELVSPPEGIEPAIPPPSTDTATTGARITVRLQAAISFPPEAEVERLLTMPTPLPSPLTSLSP
nr:hypothetical protein [Tanacetum cinerariifolium]